MHRLLLSLMILGSALSPAIAQKNSGVIASGDTAQLEALSKEYEAATKRFSVELRQAYQAAKTAGKQETFQFKKDHPGISFSRRFLALAEQAPATASGFDAIRMALNTSGGPDGKAGTWAGAIALLREHYAEKPGIKRIVTMVASFGDEAGDQFVRDVIAKNPNRELQAKAYQSMADAREEVAGTAKLLKENDELRTRFEKVRGKDEVARRIARGDSAMKEAEELRRTLREKYGDIVADLSIGRTMPELTSETPDGRTARLSELKGKVVVLDIWATWCGPCKAMIPHEREMVERLKDKPFELVSISADEKVETLKGFLAKEKMPWTHWWNGSEGKLMDTLNIQHFPTIFVIDGEGVIRHKEIRGEELEKAVDELLEEMEAKKTASK